MRSKDLRREIEAKLGISLEAEEISEDRLRKMRKLADEPPSRATDLVEIATDPPQERLPDPRYSNRCYRRSFYDQWRLHRSPLLNVPPLEVVLDLDHTLVECILPPNAQRDAVLEYRKKIEREQPTVRIDLLETKAPDGRLVWMIFSVRPGAESLLRKLKKFANLTLFTKAQETYVKDILMKLQWHDLFDKVVCESEVCKNISARLENLSRDRIVIVDDQLRTWVEDDQSLIVPVTRYMPLFSYDFNCSENRRHAERFLTYGFMKEIPDLKENSESEARKWFLDGFNPKQMESIVEILREVHKHMFIDRQSASSAFRYLLSRRLYGKKFSVSLSPENPDKDALLKRLIEQMGGRIAPPGTGVTVISTEERGEARTVRELIDEFFKPRKRF